MDELFNDVGWDKAFEGPDDLTPKRNKELKTKLINRNLICASGGNIYVFLPTINTWSIMCSNQATVFLNSLMEMDSATVRFSQAFSPYVEYLERNAADKIANPVPQSICIGTTRLKTTLIPNGLQLSECESLIPSLPESMKIPARLCYMSLALRHWPRIWHRTSNYPMYQFLRPLFPYDIELKTIEWTVGHALIDPHSYSKAVILYGEGGHGKSTMLAALNIALLGCCGTIPDRSLVALTKGMTQDVASVVVSNRIVTAGDVGSLDENTNLSVIKTLTGHDYISMPPSRARSACTLFYASNRLDDPLRNPEWVTPAIMRRVVVVPMNATIPEGLDDTVPQDTNSRLDFALRCVHTRLSTPYMPVSATSVLLTILGSKFETVAKYFQVLSDDEEADDEYIILANSIVAGVLGITTERVGELAKRISLSCVKMIQSQYYIKNIIPSEHYESQV